MKGVWSLAQKKKIVEASHSISRAAGKPLSEAKTDELAQHPILTVIMREGERFDKRERGGEDACPH